MLSSGAEGVAPDHENDFTLLSDIFPTGYHGAELAEVSPGHTVVVFGGQCPGKKYNRYLRDLIIAGRAEPSLIVSHEVGLDEAPDAYEKFDKRVDGYTKVLPHP